MHKQEEYKKLSYEIASGKTEYPGSDLPKAEECAFFVWKKKVGSRVLGKSSLILLTLFEIKHQWHCFD